jgi:hypothetical protein
MKIRTIITATRAAPELPRAGYGSILAPMLTHRRGAIIQPWQSFAGVELR